MEFAITVWGRVMDGYFFPIGPTGTGIGSKVTIWVMIG